MSSKVKANLHMHSLYSDGYQWPAEMVVRCKKMGFELVALTDHDSMEGVEEFLDGCEKFGIEGVPATEIDCCDGEIDFDMELLGYFPDGNYDNMAIFLRERLKNREKIVGNLIERGRTLFDNSELSFKDFKDFKFGFDSTILGNRIFSYIKYNLYQYFKVRGVIPKELSYKNFKKEYYTKDKLGDFDEKKPTLGFLANMIKDEGGYSVLPHPPWIIDGFDRTFLFVKEHSEEFEKIYSHCKKLGIWGIEMNYYGDETVEINEFLGGMAKDYGFSLTWGSDCHGRGSEFCNLEKYFGYFEGFKR